MSTRTVTPTVAAPIPAITPAHGTVLQRTCDCGQHTVGGVACNDCKKKKGTIHRGQDSYQVGKEMRNWPDSSDASRHERVSSKDGLSLSRGDFTEIEASTQSAPVNTPRRYLRSKQEIPLSLGGDFAPGLSSRGLDESVAHLQSGRPISSNLRSRMPRSSWPVVDQTSIHDDTQSRKTADILNSRAFTYNNHIVLGNTNQDNDWLVAHELGHVLQQNWTPKTSSTAGTATLEHEADRFADAATNSTLATSPGVLPLSPSSPGLAQKVIWKQIQDLPGDLLLILDVDDGDFVGGCVRAIVPHVGVKLIKKFPHMQLFNLHVGIVTNSAGEVCMFFYESVTGICEMLCFPSKEKLRESLGKIKEWLKSMIEKLIRALAIAILIVAAAYLAYLIAEALAGALLILLAA